MTRPGDYGRAMTRTRDLQRQLNSVNKKVDAMAADVLWCVTTLAKITKEDPPPQRTMVP